MTDFSRSSPDESELAEPWGLPESVLLPEPLQVREPGELCGVWPQAFVPARAQALLPVREPLQAREQVPELALVASESALLSEPVKALGERQPASWASAA